ncbi:FAD-dependent oxidoreductase [Bacillus tianshenii]|nr:FAD-dependent oxidoreductase [Bacillus tianshenii]
MTKQQLEKDGCGEMKKLIYPLTFISVFFVGFFIVNGFEPESTTNSYDVVVTGGEPEGVAAAVSAARNGSKVLLVAPREGLGGLMTYGKLNYLDIPNGADGNSVSEGIFKEWHKMVGGKSVFDVKKGKKAFHKLVEDEPNITLWTNTEVKEVLKKDNQLTGLVVNRNGNQVRVDGKQFIDATQDADIAAMAGVPYTVGKEDIGLDNHKMAVTLMIHLKGVDWDGIKKAVKTKKFGKGGINKTAAWGFTDLHHLYKPNQERARLRGLNVARQEDGTVYINALQIFGVDGLDKQSKQNAIKRGKVETNQIVKFLRKEFPGFENAQVASYPNELYVRETRHIEAEYTLDIGDVWENRDHWDQIALGGYPADIQAANVNDYGMVVVNPKQYAIPFRSIVPKKVDGLLVASRSAGYDSLASGSARVIPTGMAVAEAAGVAADLAIKENVTFREISKTKWLIDTVQVRLKKQGAEVKEYKLSYPYKGKWFYPSFKTLLEWGLIKGGYKNDIHPDEKMAASEFAASLQNGFSRIADKKVLTDKSLWSDSKTITRDEAAQLIVASITGEQTEDPWQTVYNKGWVDHELTKRLDKNEPLTNAEAYYWLGFIMERVETQKNMVMQGTAMNKLPHYLVFSTLF